MSMKKGRRIGLPFTGEANERFFSSNFYLHTSGGYIDHDLQIDLIDRLQIDHL